MGSAESSSVRSRGVVAAFDEARGLGTVRDENGIETFFHCTAIAGGARTIDVGSTVEYAVVPGHIGQWEAAEIIQR